MVDRNINIYGWNEMHGANVGQPAEMRKTPYGFSNKKVDNELANLLSGGGNPTQLDTHNEYVKISDYLNQNKNNLTLGDREIIENMLQEYKTQEEAFERRNESHTCPASPETDYTTSDTKDKTNENANLEAATGEEVINETKNTKTNEQKNITPAERKAARENGADVAKQLIGYTTEDEQKLIGVDLEKVNSENVIDFFKGYEKQLLKKENSFGNAFVKGLALGSTGAILTLPDHFFEQMITENKFNEKQDLARGVAKNLQEYMSNKYGENSEIATEIAIILEDPELSKEQAKILDQYVLQEISPQNIKKNRAQAFGLMGVMGAAINSYKAE